MKAVAIQSPIQIPHFMRYLFDHAFLIYKEKAQAKERAKYISGNARGKEQYWVAANYQAFTDAVAKGYEVLPELITEQEAVSALFEGKRIQRTEDKKVFFVNNGILHEVEGKNVRVSPESPFSWLGQVFEVLKEA